MVRFLSDTTPVQWGFTEDQHTVLHRSSFMFDAPIVQTVISLGVAGIVVVVDEAHGDSVAL